jgi:hypothetical protein
VVENDSEGLNYFLFVYFETCFIYCRNFLIFARNFTYLPLEITERYHKLSSGNVICKGNLRAEKGTVKPGRCQDLPKMRVKCCSFSCSCLKKTKVIVTALWSLLFRFGIKYLKELGTLMYICLFKRSLFCTHITYTQGHRLCGLF